MGTDFCVPNAIRCYFTGIFTVDAAVSPRFA
jgi:hypothetical protein